MTKQRGLFIGLSTVDVQYKVDRFPEPNSELNAEQFAMQPGGPAYNAAVTFSFLGGDATVVSVVGDGSLASFIKRDASLNNVALRDAKPTATEVPVSSILTEASNGNRTIIYHSHRIDGLQPVEVTDRFDTILVDGYYPELAVPILKAQAGQATVVLDADVWNDGTDPIMRFVDIVICSEDFVPPETDSRESVRQAILGYGPARCAFTHGARPIEWFDEHGGGTVDIPKVDVVDTLGAGDIFHGAFCFYYAATGSFEDALARASIVTGTSCTSFGTRSWMALPEAQRLQQENAP